MAGIGISISNTVTITITNRFSTESVTNVCCRWQLCSRSSVWCGSCQGSRSYEHFDNLVISEISMEILTWGEEGTCNSPLIFVPGPAYACSMHLQVDNSQSPHTREQIKTSCQKMLAQAFFPSLPHFSSPMAVAASHANSF